jgi:hypothetical protein
MSLSDFECFNMGFRTEFHVESLGCISAVALHRASHGRVAQQVMRQVRELDVITRGYYETRYLVNDGLAHSADVGTDDRNAQRHRLSNHGWDPLGARLRCQPEDVQGANQVRDATLWIPHDQVLI